MELFIDFEGRLITLSDASRDHAFDHALVSENLHRFGETHGSPDIHVLSKSDPRTWMYYKYYPDFGTGGKYLCIVVKKLLEEAYISTAYVTRIK